MQHQACCSYVGLHVEKPIRDGLLESCDKAIELDPNLGPAYIWRSLTHLLMGDFDASINDSESAIRVDPLEVSSEAHGLRILGYLGKGDLDRSEGACTTAKQVESRSEVALFACGVLHIYQKRTDQGIAETDETIRTASDTIDLLTSRAMVFASVGDYKRARFDYLEIIRKAPDSAFAYNNLGMMSFRLGDLQSALSEISQAIKLKPSDPTLYSNRAAIYMQENKTELALADFKLSRKLAQPQNYLQRLVSKKP